MPQVPTSALARVFTWIGLTSLGGGRAAYFYEAFVARRRWVGSQEFLQDLTLSQLLPGPTASNLAVALGHRLRGAAGAACALLAILVPGALVLLALSTIYFGRGVPASVETALKGMGAAVVGMLFITTARLSRGALKGRGAIGIAALAFLGAGPLRLNAVLVIVVAGAISLWIHRPGRPGGGADQRTATDPTLGPAGGPGPSPPATP